MNRECWADYAKAIAITLMCMCHFYLSSEEMRLFIYMFHMPVFYFISGYFDKGKSVSCESVKNNIRKLIIPYMFFSMISIPMGCFVAYHNPEIYGNNELWQQIIKCLLGILIMDDTIKSYAFLPNGPLWFLISLFVARIIFSVFIRLATERKIWMIFVLSLFLIVVYGLHPSCFSIDSACLAIPIYAFGFLSKKVNILKYFDSLKLCYVTVILGLFYLLGIGMNNGNVDIDKNIVGDNIFCFYLNALIGSMVLIIGCKVIALFPKNRFCRIVSIVGQSTLTILGTHKIIGLFCKLIVIDFLGCNSDDFSYVICLIMTILSILGGVLLHQFIIKNLPFIIDR